VIYGSQYNVTCEVDSFLKYKKSLEFDVPLIAFEEFCMSKIGNFPPQLVKTRLDHFFKRCVLSGDSNGNWKFLNFNKDGNIVCIVTNKNFAIKLILKKQEAIPEAMSNAIKLFLNKTKGFIEIYTTESIILRDLEDIKYVHMFAQCVFESLD